MTVVLLRKRALLFVGIGEVWNLFEAVIALWVAFEANSVALLAYGLDSVIELFAGGVLLWRFWKDREGEETVVEAKALRIVGVTFFLLSIFILFQSLATLAGLFAEPQPSIIGIVLTILSAIVMTILFVLKSNLAKRLGSRALRAEAYESLICDIQDVVLLFGLGLNKLLGWWWADPLVALVLIPFLLKEGWESVFEKKESNCTIISQ